MYFQKLSRNSRSNLHKAYSKASRLQKAISLKVVKGPIKEHKFLSDIIKIYTKRESERKQRKIHVIPFLKHRYFSALTWAIENLESQYTFCLFLDTKPASFMTGFMTNFQEIVFPLVAMDSTYSTFAPGKIMINESIQYLQSNSDIRYLDLSRGDERYKMEMGGEKHYNYKIFISL